MQNVLFARTLKLSTVARITRKFPEILGTNDHNVASTLMNMVKLD